MCFYVSFADVAELADALDSGSSEGFLVQVQILSSALLAEGNIGSDITVTSAASAGGDVGSDIGGIGQSLILMEWAFSFMAVSGAKLQVLN